ncbi:putative glycerophosphodiester phosphodiesterase, protein kinase RLK-Pelle-LRK10L-2 family [Rosa chinensis]|uniref:Putative glycerophosphodiester phosphodiesterase, protein kinase RLK-Pelle-LRK10L-2 family n=1 Tax=Rosa chinensis TaxID=74649 RepID=A0A2P6SC47_ROSCH|nr:rust resistance kinase Lr10 [Rosa chinensis]PRQ56237.1 putative glycerophosphodiester phosphodiesterase, protein kinase RLK-Pelle-LRK10L-2 family [Rosa chinensis]
MGISGIRSLSLCGWVSIVALFVLGLSTASSSGKIHTTSVLGDNRTCVPSSCGDVHNIRYPFRQQNDPQHCGDQRFTLECHNNITVLRQISHEYYVKVIDYDNSLIRVVDPGLEKNNCSSLPRFPLAPSDFSDGYTYSLNDSIPLTFLKCANPVNSSLYVNTAPCIKSKGHGYAILGHTSLEDLENGCSIDWIWKGMNRMITSTDGKDRNISYQDIHNELMKGFELHYSLPNYYLPIHYPQRNYCHGQWRYRNKTCYPRSIPGLFQLVRTALTDHGAFVRIIAVGVLDCVVGVKLIYGGPFVIGLLIYKWRRRHWSAYNTIEDFLHGDNFMPIRYSYSDIKKMFGNFKDKLGEGGYGSVFKGKLRSGHFAAIKLLGKSNANGEDFMSEVATIGRIHHVNVVQLVGYCVEGSKRALVYDFMSNGSLDKYIYSKEGSITLTYKKMYEIAVGVAQGIEYLHQGCEMQILHFDIKPHNILLDENFIPKISDFGLAKLYPANNSIISSVAARGTMGYIAPELFYKNIGGVSYKADVYSFGMLLMEMASRRKNLNALVDHSSQLYFPSWVHDQYSDGKDLEIGDATAEEKKLIKKMIVTALWCIQMKPSDRPSMKRVTQILVGDVEYLEMPPKPSLCPQPMPVSNLIPACSNVELTCTLSAR